MIEFQEDGVSGGSGRDRIKEPQRPRRSITVYVGSGAVVLLLIIILIILFL